MCKRVLLIAAAGTILTSYQGKAHSVISVDTRCAMNKSWNDELGKNVLSFADTDKPGVIVLDPSFTVVAAEFTDFVPEEALILEFTGSENEQGAEQQAA